MSIGKIMYSAFKCAKFGVKYAKSATKSVVQEVKPQNLLKATPKAPQMTILGKVDTNTQGRILRMQDAKQVFTPAKPYATKVTKESVPTLQKINEITGVQRGIVKDTTGYFNKRAAADALAAFKYEPVQLQHATLKVTSHPTQQALDDMLGVAKVDALKIFENGGRATREILEKRADVRKAFLDKSDLVLKRKFMNFDSYKQTTSEFDKKYGKVMKILEKPHWSHRDFLDAMSKIKQV